jgi:hypothetical protein
MMLHSGRVLVVTDDPGMADVWAASLELAGYDTDTCAGPGAARDCPRLHGSQCSLRERVDVAVLDLDCDEDALVCTRVPDDGSTVFVRRSVTPVDPPELCKAIDGALRHVEQLNAAPLLDRVVIAPDLD